MTISVIGFSTTMKVPGFFADTIYNAGPISIGDIPLICLLVGNQLSAGTATPNQDINNIFSTADADTYYGAGSELAVMCYSALQIPGVKIKAAACSEGGGAVAATATITITGSWTTGGTITYRVDGVAVYVTVLATDTISSLADSIVAAIAAQSHLSVTAVKGAGAAFVVTLTRKSKGPRGNQGTLAQDITGNPVGCVSTIAGGSALTGGIVPFTGGTTADNLTTLLGILGSDQYDRIAFAENDATNAAKIKTFLNTQAGSLIGYLMHAVVAVNSTLSAATSLAQTTLNAERVEVLWYLNSETIPSAISAVFTAYRTSIEQTDPDAAYDGYELPGVLPQQFQADWPITNTLISALDNSVTPIATNRTGSAYIVRAITSHSLDASGNPDYRTLDVSQAVVPDYVRNTLRLYWLTSFKIQNPKVGPDPAATARPAPAGLATPTGWNRQVTGILYGLQDNLIVTNVVTNLPVSEYNVTAKRIMSIVPVVACPNQHQIGVSVRGVG